MILFWLGILALATLLYVVLDGFDLGSASYSPSHRRRTSGARCWR